MCGPALFHQCGEGQIECETEAVGDLKTGVWMAEVSCNHRVPGHGPSGWTVPVWKHYYPHCKHMFSQNRVCVCQVACLSDSSVRFIDLIASS